MKNRCKFDARKRDAKIMKNAPKCIQNGSQNQQKSLKKRGSKMCWFLGSIFGDPKCPRCWLNGLRPGEHPAGNPTKKEQELEGNSRGQSPNPNTPAARGEPPARSGSQLPAAIFPLRALERRKPEVKTSFGLCFEWIQKDYWRN